MNRWITDPTKSAAFTRAYEGEEWRQCVNLAESQRRRCLLDTYKAALKDPKRGNAKYVTSFVMFDKSEQPLYWLVFCTNNLQGLYEMKRAMWSVDKSGAFRFSDRDNPAQLKLLEDCFDQKWLATELAEKLGNKTMTVAELREYVLVETPCYLFREALKSLETGKNKAVTVVKQPAGRKPGAYKDEALKQIVVKFHPSLLGG